MGVNGVIAQVAALLRTVPELASVYEYAPLLVTPDELPRAWVRVLGWREERFGLGGAVNQGKKRRFYQVEVDLRLASHEPRDDEPRFRTLVEAVEAKLRANQTLGGSVVRFGEDLRVSVSEPVADATTVHYHAVVESEAVEEITA